MIKKAASDASPCPLTSSGNKKLMAYAAVGSLGAFGASEGATILNDGSIDGPAVAGGISTWEIDLNGDDTTDVFVKLDPDGGFTYYPGTNTYPILTATGAGSNGVAVVSVSYNANIYRYAQKFASSLIGGSIGANVASDWSPVGEPTRLRDGYGFENSRWGLSESRGAVVVKFDISGADHYGFFTLQLNTPYTDDGGEWPGSGDNFPTFGDYGYESVAGANIGIPEGSVIPEPTSLSFLAAGAAGLMAMRRRRSNK